MMVTRNKSHLPAVIEETLYKCKNNWTAPVYSARWLTMDLVWLVLKGFPDKKNIKIACLLRHCPIVW